MSVLLPIGRTPTCGRAGFGDAHLTQQICPVVRTSAWAAVVGTGLIVFWALLIGAVSANAQSNGPDRGNDEIARVNDVVITRREFQTVYRQAVDRHAQEGLPVDEFHIAPLRRKVIQRMVEEELLVQESRRIGIAISSEEIDRDVAAARARFATPAGFQEELARQYWDETGYRRHLKRQKTIDRLLAQQVDPSISVSEEEIRRFYEANPQRFHSPEKIRVRRILIRKEVGDENLSPADAYRKIVMIREKLDQGEDFADLAAEYSQEPMRGQGGDLGYIERGQMPPSIESTVFSLAVGDISPVLTTGNDYLLIQVTDRRDATTISFEEARSDIQTTLLQIKKQSAVRAYIDTLRKRAEIQASQ